MKQKLRLKMLKISCIYGGVPNMILVGACILFAVTFSGYIEEKEVLRNRNHYMTIPQIYQR